MSKGGSSTLAQAGRELAAAWEEARARWRDAKAEDFQRAHLDELPGVLAKCRESIEEIDRFLHVVRSDCE